ncbi:class I SAM-dependent methyltransferase, partial [Pseudomonas syringae pv. tagetis]|uniref:class I SAM-dependent methyltransferase n=1 Tax=Pseudomonas syringae group genomosp. 7 TaxID=251699 RepID=UPI00376F9B78
TQAPLDEDDTAENPARVQHDKATDAASIAYHYDVSNEFNQLWLDREMDYSCAYFRTGEESMQRAQQDKLHKMCRKLR